MVSSAAPQQQVRIPASAEQGRLQDNYTHCQQTLPANDDPFFRLPLYIVVVGTRRMCRQLGTCLSHTPNNQVQLHSPLCCITLTPFAIRHTTVAITVRP